MRPPCAPHESAIRLTTDNERPLNTNGETTIMYEMDSLNRGNVTFNITIDSNGNISESSENDNTASVSAYIY